MLPTLDLPLPVLWAAGLLLLAFGRRLYWLFIGLAGFAVGFLLAERLVDVGPGWVDLAVAAVIGVAAAFFAGFFQKIAVGLIGFVGGAGLLILIADALAWSPGSWIWLIALAAGLAGAVVTRAIFELALVILSSLAGASLLVQASGWLDPRASYLLVGLTLAGCLFQLLFNRRRKRSD